MGRSPRVEYEGAIYHLMSRGNRQEPVFLDDLDSRMFLELWEEAWMAGACLCFDGQPLSSVD